MTPLPNDITARLSRFIAASGVADWPEEILELGRRHILDTLAAIVACGERESARLARAFALQQSGHEAAPAPLLGTQARAALTDAVFASAMAAHGAEINDFCPSAFVQPGPAVVSAGLCAAVVDRASGAALLRSVITGYELTCRIPKALGIQRGRRLGYASHGYGPVFGAAAALASLRRYPEPTIRHMLSYCAQQASGSLQWLLDVGHVEKSFVFAGMPARNGVHAALLAEAGFSGVPDAFDAAGGWFSSGLFCSRASDFDPSYLVDELDTRFELPLVAYKRYPVGGPVQPVVQAMLELAPHVTSDAIESIEVEMPDGAHVFANASMPALNLPYLCAVIAIDGALSFAMADSQERKTHDVVVQRLMTRVRVKHDPTQDAIPRKESARVTLRRRDGRTHNAFVEHVKGYPSHPMSRADVEDKARELLAPVLGQSRASALIELVWRVDTLADASVLAAAMVTA